MICILLYSHRLFVHFLSYSTYCIWLYLYTLCKLYELGLKHTGLSVKLSRSYSNKNCYTNPGRQAKTSGKCACVSEQLWQNGISQKDHGIFNELVNDGVNEYMDGWMNTWMDEWINECMSSAWYFPNIIFYIDVENENNLQTGTAYINIVIHDYRFNKFTSKINIFLYYAIITDKTRIASYIFGINVCM